MSVPWDVTWSEKAFKDLNSLDNRLIDRVADAVERYAQTGAGDIQRLQGISPPERRLRVGDWRVRFAFATASHAIIVLRVALRGSAYGG